MAPQPKTRQAQRIDLVEEAVAELCRSMKNKVLTAVNRVV